MTAAEKIKEMGIVPVVVLEDEKDAGALAKALCEGGLPCAEVTFRTAAAKESIRIMLKEYPEMFVGAGTVLTTRQVDEAIEAGAKFIVSPGFDPEIVNYCLEKEIPVFPGCISPSEVAQAVKRGLKVVKFFPAEPAGGVAMIKAMAAPYNQLRFMPTGGIGTQNLKDYLGFELDGDIQVMDYSALTASLAEGKLDIGMAALCATDQRKEVMNFSKTYYDAGQVVMVNTESSPKEITGEEALRSGDYKVAVEKGTASHMYAQANFPESCIGVHDTITPVMNPWNRVR